MTDPFAASAIPLNAPATHAAAIAPDDDADLPTVSRAIYVGGAGDLVAVPAGDADGAAVTFKNAGAGQVLPIRVKRVLATGTTATNLVALY